MLRNVRRGVFETSSSSMHSVSMWGSADEGNRAGFVPGQSYPVAFGEYGWERDELRTPGEKLSYVLTSLQYLDAELRFYDASHAFVGTAEALRQIEASTHFRWLREMVKDYTGAELVVEPMAGSGWSDIGHVDHQSIDVLEPYWSEDEDAFKSAMRDLVFGSAVIETDNDND